MDEPDDARGFFDDVYRAADGDDGAVPWQHAMSRPLAAGLVDRLGAGEGRSALVVACGLGDDAAALAARGWQVTAFDAAPRAVEWAAERHPGASVDWRVADLFDPPATWTSRFALVVEVFTVQSIDPVRHLDAVGAVRRFVAPGGRLAAVALVRAAGTGPSGPPWPLTPEALAALLDGLPEGADETVPAGEGVTCVAAVRTVTG